MTTKSTRQSFLLSVIFHALLLLFLLSGPFIFTFNPKKIEEKSPELYIPSYVYKGNITPAAQQAVARSAAQTQPVMKAQQSAPSIQKMQNKSGTLASSIPKNNSFQPKSILEMSRNLIQKNQVNTALNRLNNAEPPILLVGDKRAIVDPLVKLLGRSLSAHFHYPKIEGMFGARGKVYVELVLHPEGYFSDVQIVLSSDIQDFNAAALYAVNTAPTVVGANKFLSRPTRFVVGFLFE